MRRRAHTHRRHTTHDTGSIACSAYRKIIIKSDQWGHQLEHCSSSKRKGDCHSQAKIRVCAVCAYGAIGCRQSRFLLAIHHAIFFWAFFPFFILFHFCRMRHVSMLCVPTLPGHEIDMNKEFIYKQDPLWSLLFHIQHSNGEAFVFARKQ